MMAPAEVKIRFHSQAAVLCFCLHRNGQCFVFGAAFFGGLRGRSVAKVDLGDGARCRMHRCGYVNNMHIGFCLSLVISFGRKLQDMPSGIFYTARYSFLLTFFMV